MSPPGLLRRVGNCRANRPRSRYGAVGGWSRLWRGSWVRFFRNAACGRSTVRQRRMGGADLCVACFLLPSPRHSGGGAGGGPGKTGRKQRPGSVVQISVLAATRLSTLVAQRPQKLKFEGLTHVCGRNRSGTNSGLPRDTVLHGPALGWADEKVLCFRFDSVYRGTSPSGRGRAVRPGRGLPSSGELPRKSRCRALSRGLDRDLSRRER